MNEIFSTCDMARLCGVNESTIKRWADSGRLPCVRTPGGHRKFRIRDALSFLSEHGFEGLGLDHETSRSEDEDRHAALIFERNWDGLAGRYLELGLAGSSPNLVQFLFRLVTAGCTLVEICDRVISPALVMLGDRWQAGSVSILEEHLMSAGTIHALARLRETLPQQASNGLLALCTPVEGEQHEIGARMSALLLDRLGWDVRLSVDGTPTPELVRFVKRERPRLLCLSACSSREDGEFLEAARLLRQATLETGTRLAFGGRGTQGDNQVSCDMIGGSMASLESLAGGLAGHRGVGRASR
ncbi:MAG: putative cobalamin binding protein [bacterium]|nr:MAG: putative cobalamin binding protein [bacterium]